MNNELPKRNSFLWIIIVIAVVLVGIGVWFLLGNKVNVATDTISYGKEILIEYPILENYSKEDISEYCKEYSGSKGSIIVLIRRDESEEYLKWIRKHYEKDKNISNLQISETKKIKFGKRICYYQEVSYDSQVCPINRIDVCTAIGEDKIFLVYIEKLNDKKMSIDNFKEELATLFDIKVKTIE